jgi:hypothetical protein
MTKAGERLLAGMNEALSIVRGESRPASVHHGAAVMRKVEVLRAAGHGVEEQGYSGLVAS